MAQSIPISQARQNLSQLLKRIQKHPDRVFTITLNGVAVGELRYPEQKKKKPRAASALLAAADLAGEPTEAYPKGVVVSQDHDDFII